MVQVAAVDVQAGSVGHQLLLLVGLLVGGSFEGGSQRIALVSRMLFDFEIERRVDELLPLRVHVGLQFRGVGLNGGGLCSILVRVQRNNPVAWDDPALGIECRFKNRSQLKIVGLRDRVVAVIMTLRTADAQPEQAR